MAALASTNLSVFTPSHKVETHLWDATNLSSVLDSSISHLLSCAALYLLPETALTEACRVVSPSGVIGLTTMVVHRCAWAYLFFESIPAYKPDFDPSNMPRLNDNWYTPEGVRAELQKIGLKDIVTEELKIWMEFEDADEVVRFLTVGMPFVNMLAKGLSDEAVEEWIKSIVERVQREFPENRLPGLAIIGIGRRQ